MKAVDASVADEPLAAPPSIRVWVRPWQPGMDSLQECAAALGAERTGQPVRLSRSLSGRPILHEPPGHVSISHTRNLLALCHAGQPAGIDIELRRRERPWVALAERYFSTSEHRVVAAAEDPGERFLRFWVAKEALLKCLGLGIAGHIGDIELANIETNWPSVLRLPGGRPPRGFGVRIWQNETCFIGLAVESAIYPRSWTIDGPSLWSDEHDR